MATEQPGHDGARDLVIDRVAHAFWQVMLKDPQDLPEYCDYFYHLGAGVEVRFGVRDGEPFMKEVAG